MAEVSDLNHASQIATMSNIHLLETLHPADAFLIKPLHKVNEVLIEQE